MKYSIKYLPKKRQDELNTLVELITSRVNKCEMIILFGSYARNNHVYYDETYELGAKVTFQSDYDLLVVVSNVDTFNIEHKTCVGIIDRYHKQFDGLHSAPPPGIIVEDIKILNKEIEKNRYFYLEILKEGRKLYDTGNFKLAKPKHLSAIQIKEEAKNYFEDSFSDAEGFRNLSDTALNQPKIKLTAFLLHQACENLYKTISLVFTLDKPKMHKLERLESMNKKFVREIVSIFPRETLFEKQCYTLLCKAYVDARYKRNYKVTKEELQYMMSRIDILKEIVKKACEERLAYYDKLIEEEKSDTKYR